MTLPANLSAKWAPVDEDALRRAYAAAEPYPFVSVDGFLEADFARALARSLPGLDDARQLGREFSAVNERGKVQITRTEHFSEVVRALNDLMASERLLELFERITGIRSLLADDELVGGGIHVMAPGSHLDVHVDFNRIEERGIYRRLNALLFLNEDWRDEWGGELELWDAGVRRRHHVFAPRMNRLVLFETSEHSFHGVRRVRCPKGVARCSFATYYYTREMPAGRAVAHDTLFRARPGEWWKGRVRMPVEHALESSRLALRRLGSRVKRSLRPR